MMATDRSACLPVCVSDDLDVVVDAHEHSLAGEVHVLEVLLAIERVGLEARVVLGVAQRKRQLDDVVGGGGRRCAGRAAGGRVDVRQVTAEVVLVLLQQVVREETAGERQATGQPGIVSVSHGDQEGGESRGGEGMDSDECDGSVCVDGPSAATGVGSAWDEKIRAASGVRP